jgi:uncharacterized protein (TIGR00255 family)
MILSMTGFGSGRAEVPNLSISVEAKTVNHRHLDLHIRLPAEFQNLEPVVRKVVSGKLRRGRVDMFVKIELTTKGVKMEADPAIIESYIELVRELQRRFPITGDLTLEAIAKVPGAIAVSSDNLASEDQLAVSRNLEKASLAAIEQVLEMRKKEGTALVEDLKQRIAAIGGLLETIRQGATGVLQHYRELLTSRVAELAPNLNVDSSRLEIEALIHAEKSDIAEEITRLTSHLDHFTEITSREAEAGKRLDFLLQEMNREATTILSKTSGLNQSGVSIGEAAIEIKVEIDKLREQVQNIE